jgi:magnesium transporter
MSIKSKKKRSQKSGLPPGSPVYIGEDKTTKVKITILDYDENNFEEKVVNNPKECCVFRDKPTVTWINVDGIHEVDVIEKIGRDFGFHPLLLEDILNTEQRPKIEFFDDHIFIVLRMLSITESSAEVKSEQVSLVFGKNFVISFQEDEEDILDPLRDRIRTAKGRIRRMGADFLAYSIIDAIVDNYFVILEQLGGS